MVFLISICISVFFSILIGKYNSGGDAAIKIEKCKAISENAFPSGVELQNFVNTVNNFNGTPNERKQLGDLEIKNYKSKAYIDCLRR